MRAAFRRIVLVALLMVIATSSGQMATARQILPIAYPRRSPHTATSPAQVPTGFFPQGIAASTTFVYAENSDDNSVSMFTIDTTSGLLTPLSPPETFVPPLFPSRSSVSSPDFVTVHRS